MAPLGSADASGQRAHDAPKHVHARRPKKYLGDGVIVGRESSGGGTLGQFIRFWGSTEMRRLLATCLCKMDCKGPNLELGLQFPPTHGGTQQ